MTKDLPRTGRLREIRLPRILTFIQRQKITGSLLLRQNEQLKEIYIKNGDIIFATSQYADDRLGEYLLKKGKISLAQYERSVELVVTTGKRQGSLLVEEGFITPKELFEFVTDQVRDIIMSVFAWTDGDYEIEEGDPKSQEVLTLNMSTGKLIYDGIKGINDWVRLRSEIPSLDTILRMTTDPLILFQRVSLSETERKFLSLMDAKRNIRQLFEGSGLGSFETLKLIHFLFSTDTVEVCDEAENLKKESQAAAVSEEIFKSPENDGGMSREDLLQAYEILPQQNHYEVLSVSREGSSAPIKKAYFRLAKEYHPDRHFSSGMEQMKEKLEVLFARITVSYDTLMAKEERQSYDMDLAAGKIQGDGGEKKKTVSIEEKVGLGQVALKKGDFKNAVYFFDQAVDAVNDKGVYHSLLAQALTGVPGRGRDAESHFKKAVELDPASVDNYVQLGLMYKKAGLTQRAIGQFEQALKWDPAHRLAMDELALLNKKAPN